MRRRKSQKVEDIDADIREMAGQRQRLIEQTSHAKRDTAYYAAVAMYDQTIAKLRKDMEQAAEDDFNE